MKLSNPLKSAIIIGLTGVVILCLVIYVELKTSAINNENQPLIALVEHLKDNSSKAHLWFEEAMAGDTTIVLDRDVYGYLDSSAKVLKAVLLGGQTGLGIFHKTTDSETVRIINISLFSCDVFKSLAKQRMGFKIKSHSNAGVIHSKTKSVINYGEEIGGVLDQAFDAAYQKLQDDYSLLAEHIRLKIAQDNRILYSLFWTSILLIIIVFAVFSFLLYRILKNESLAKQALIVSEKRFRAIFEEAPIGIVLVDSTTGVIYEANSKYLNIVGRSKEDVNKMDWMSITHPADLQEGLETKALMVAKKTRGFKALKRYIRPDKSIIWVDISVVPIETESKTQICHLSMVEDVTERKRIEEALRLSENELRNMFACMDDVIFELSSDGVYLKIAPTNPSLLYKPADTLLGKYLNEVLPEKEAEWFSTKIRETLKENKIIHTEYTLFIENKMHVFEGTVSPLTNHSVLWIARDITARKQAEEQIIKSQQNLEGAQKLAHIGSWEFSLVTSELIWSKEQYQIFELENEPNHTLYQSYRNKHHPEDLIKLDSAISKAIETGEGFNYEHRIVCNDGTIKYLSCIGETIKKGDGKVIGLKGTGQDITERKKMENLLKRKEQNALLVRHAEQVPGVIYQIQLSPDRKTYSFPFVSEGVQELCEVSAEDVMRDGFQVFRYVDKEDWKKIMSTFKASVDTMENWTCDYRVDLPQKGTRWLRANSKPEKLVDGSIIWHGYLSDITERKMVTYQLDKQKEFYEKILNNLPIEIAVFDEEHRYLFVNPASIKNDDLRKYIIGKDDFEYCEYRKRDKSVAQNRREQFLKVKQQGKAIEWEDSIVDANGKTFSNLRGMLPIYNDKGEFTQAIGFGIDITIRKEIEQRLIESEELLSRILQTLPVAVFCKDIQKDFQFSLWNKKAEEIFGLTAEQSIGKNDYYFFSKEAADWYRKNDIEASRMKAVLDIPEEVVETKDKKVIVHTQKTVVRDFKGNPRFLLAVSEDITERKQAEEKIKKSEEKYRSVVENAADMIMTIDKDSKLQFINHLDPGTSLEKIIGTSIYSYIPLQYHEIVKQKLNEVFETKKSQRYEIQGDRTDGTIGWYSTNAAPLFSGDEVISITLIVRDVTERKQAEEKIKQSEEKYRSVVENAADTIITFDKNDMIQFINHTRPNTTVAQVIGTSIYNFIPPEYREDVKQKIQKAFQNKTIQNYELPVKHSDGEIAWYSTNIGPVFSGDEVTALTIIIRNITERKIAEEKIKQSLKEKEVLLQEVHHRVKNNLQIIVSILNLQYATIKDKKTLELLRDVRSRIKAMSFIHELLYQTEDFSNINFSEYITSITTNLVYSYTPNKTVDLKIDVGTIFLDLDKAIPCGLIVNELFTNALKYAFSPIDKGLISISLKQTDEFITLIIADNGKGLPGNVNYKNTESLGMQLVMTLVEQLKGNISLNNSGGAEYTITFQNK